MGVKFLTAEWVDAMREAAEYSGLARDLTDAGLVFQYTVRDVPGGGEVRYFAGARDGKLTFGLGEIADPDVRITEGYQTASSIVRGDLPLQAAFMTGQVVIEGNMEVVRRHEEAATELLRLRSAVATEW